MLPLRREHVHAAVRGRVDAPLAIHCQPVGSAREAFVGFASSNVLCEVAAVPQIAADDPASVARGREIYIQQSCHACHGKEGRGDGQQVMVDNDGVPTRPRDLTAGIFKGGHDPASIYRRIALGMPGTPHPASPSLSEEETIALVHFCQSLAKEPMRQSTNHEREVQAARR